MSKWSEEFIATYGTTGKVKEIMNQMEKIVYQKEIEKKLSEVAQGKWKRRGNFN